MNNFLLLLTSGDVVGEARMVLGQRGYLRYKIPFPFDMDGFMRESPWTDTNLIESIEANFTPLRFYCETENRSIFEQAEAKQSVESKQFSAKTSEEYSLRKPQPVGYFGR